MTTDKQIEPQNPDTTTDEADTSVEADRKTQGVRHPRKLSRKSNIIRGKG